MRKIFTGIITSVLVITALLLLAISPSLLEHLSIRNYWYFKDWGGLTLHAAEGALHWDKQRDLGAYGS